MDPNEKIQLDDISFDDVIGGDGVSLEDGIDPIDDIPGDDLSDDKDKEAADLAAAEKAAADKALEDSDDSDDDDSDDDKDDLKKDDLKKDDNDDDGEGSIISEIMGKLGYDIEGTEYEDTPEGIAELTTDIASQMADERVDEVMAAFPLVKEHLEYVLAGGDSQKFMAANDPSSDYGTMELEEGDIRTQKQVLANYFTAKGHDKEFIKEMVDDFEDSGKLFAKADAAKTALSNQQVAQRSQMVEKQREEKAASETKLTEFWNGVADTIEESKEFAGIKVPDRDKNKFFEYLSAPVTKNGQTQRDVDHQDAKMDVKLAIDYLMYKGFDLKGIVDTKAKTQNAKSLRDRIGKNEETAKNARRNTRKRGGDVDLESLDLTIQ
jgi:hypothetical protein